MAGKAGGPQNGHQEEDGHREIGMIGAEDGKRRSVGRTTLTCGGLKSGEIGGQKAVEECGFDTESGKRPTTL